VDNSHRATGAAGTQLFAEGTMFARSNWCVIQTGGVDRDFVPAMHWLVRKSLRVIRIIQGLRVKERTVGLTEIACWPAGEGDTGDSKKQ
jgi:hypothetical protein